MTNSTDQFETRLGQRPAVPVRGWWILAFAISFLVLLSTLFFLSEDAYAKSVGKSLEGAVGGGGHKGGDGGGGGHKGGGDRSPVNEAVDAVGGGAQRSGQVLKDTSGGADHAVGKGAEPVSEVAGPMASKIAEPSRNIEPVADKSAETAQPLIKEASPIFEPVKDVAEPAVRTAGQAVEPVGAATDPIVEPVAETTRPVVEPVKKVAVPLVEPIDDDAGTLSQALDPLVNPLGQIAGPLASPVSESATPSAAPVDPMLTEPLVDPPLGQLVEAGVEPATVVPVDEAADIALLPAREPFDPASSEGAVVQSELASAVQGSLNVSSDGSTSSLTGAKQEISSARAEAPVVSKTLSSKFLAAFQGAVFSLVEDILPIQIPQPLGAAGAAAAAGSLSGGSNSDSGIGLGFLALMLVSLLGGKSLWSAREFLKPSTTLIPIIERPG